MPSEPLLLVFFFFFFFTGPAAAPARNARNLAGKTRLPHLPGRHPLLLQMFANVGRRRREQQQEAAANAGAAALEENDGGRQGDEQSSSKGITLRTIKPGDGAHYPSAGDTVRTHYEGYLMEKGGVKFDSSRERGQTFLWKVGHGQVIEGMDAAIVKMSVGQIAEVTIPCEFAYGEQGYPPVIPPRATLIFVIELIDFSSL